LYSTVLEELSVRSNLALNQKKLLNEAEGGDTAHFEQEYLALSAQVVRGGLPFFSIALS
jgi:hypothetical protein